MAAIDPLEPSLFPELALPAVKAAPKASKKPASTPSASAEPLVSEKSNQAFKTISEAATHLNIPQHVLRFWESRFSQIKPLKLKGGRRYYRPQDIEILATIKHLLYSQGYTIKGARKAFADAKKQKKPLPEVGSHKHVPKLTAEPPKAAIPAAPQGELPPLFAAINAASPQPTTPAVPTAYPNHKQALLKIRDDLMTLRAQLNGVLAN